MSFQIGLYFSVKFRAFGITFGSYTKAISLAIDTATGKLSFGDGAAPGTGATTLINEHGVLVQAWV